MTESGGALAASGAGGRNVLPRRRPENPLGAILIGGLLLLPAFFLGTIPAEMERGNYAALLIFAFPLAGLWFAATGLRRWRARSKAEGLFRCAAYPPAPGGLLQGTIEAVLPEGPGQISLRLTCSERVRRGRRTRTTVLWQDEDRVDPRWIARGPSGLTIPVAFRIPEGAPPSAHAPRQVLWRLEMIASMKGIDPELEFEIEVAGGPTPAVIDEGPDPVHDLAGAAAAWYAARMPALVFEPAAESERASDRSTTSASTASGGTFAVPRHPNYRLVRIAIVLALVAIGFSSLVLVSVRQPSIEFIVGFVLLPAIFSVAAITVTFNQLWASASLTRTDRRVQITKSLFGISSRRALDRSEIAEVGFRAGGHAGGQVTYDVLLRTTGDQSIVLARSLGDRDVAERIAARLSDFLAT